MYPGHKNWTVMQSRRRPPLPLLGCVSSMLRITSCRPQEGIKSDHQLWIGSPAWRLSGPDRRFEFLQRLLFGFEIGVIDGRPNIPPPDAYHKDIHVSLDQLDTICVTKLVRTFVLRTAAHPEHDRSGRKISARDRPSAAVSRGL